MSLRLRLLWVVIIGVSLHAVIMLILLVSDARDNVRRSQEAQGRWVAEGLMNSVANALITNDLATVQSTVALLFSEDRFLRLAVHDERGREIVDRRALDTSTVAAPPWFVKLLKLEPTPSTSEISVGGVRYGTIITLIAPRPIVENSWREVRAAIALAVFEVVVLSSLLWWLVKLGLRPLSQVGQLVGRIGAGDFLARLDSVPNPEFRGLIGTVHEMAGRIDALLKKTQEQAASEIQARRLKEFHEITDSSRSLEEKIEACLLLACRHLDMHQAVLTRLDNGRYVPISGSAVYRHENSSDADVAFGGAVTLRNELLSFHSLDECESLLRASFAALHIQAYLGTPVQVSGQTFGALNFSRATAMDRPFHLGDLEYVKLLAGWIGLALERDWRERALWEEKERAQVTLASIGDGVVTTDTTGRVSFLNAVAEQLTGWRVHEAIGQPIDTIFQIVHEQSRTPVENPILACLRKNRVVELVRNAVLLRRDGIEYAIEDSASPIRDRAGNVIGAVLVFHDVTESRQAMRQIEHFASHDQLTDLPNRRLFESSLERVLNSARFGQKVHALCYIDLDQFKIVNDTCGHMAGDDLLRQMSLLLKQRLRGADVLARLGGDEFALILTHVNEQQALNTAEQIRRLVREFRFLWQDKVFEVGASIGLVMIDERAVDIAEVLRHADIACYSAKNSGRNRVHLYRPSDTESTRFAMEMNWVQRLRQAMREDQLELWSQPIIDIRSTADAPAYFEILLRLRESNGELVPPGAFLPAAERYGIMGEIDRWVVGRLFRYLTESGGSGGTACYAINLSGVSIGEPDMLQFIKEALLETGVDPARLCFEITETAAINNLTHALGFIKELRQLGCRFALDDFGSGVSSFNYLKHLPVDIIKIDGSFVCKITDNPLDEAMVQAINQIGQVMGKKTVAEFVENDAILRRLAALGVDYAQGYGIGRPQPLEPAAPVDQRSLSA